MARPPNILKRLKEIIKNFGLGGYQDTPNTESGLPPISKDKLQQVLSQSRRRAERPTRQLPDYYFVMDVLSNMPAADAALWQMADDVAHDEDGNDSAWSVLVNVEPLDDTEASKKKAADLRAELQRIGDDYQFRTGIGYKTKQFVFKFVSCGDCFAEQVISFDVDSGTGRIEAINEIPTWQIHVETDDHCSPKAYEQHLVRNDKAPVRWNIPQQIIHWKYRATDYFPYGESAFMPLRSRWEQFKLIELDLLVAIHTRAVSPELHYVGREGGRDQLSPELRAAYRQEISDDPADINRRYILERGRVEVEFPKTGDAESIKALYNAHRDLENRFVEALGVSGHISGNVEDVAGRHISQSLDQKHARKIASLRGDFSYYVWDSVLLEYALQGYDLKKPEDYGVKSISVEPLWYRLGESPIQKSKRVIAEVLAGLTPFDDAVLQLGARNPQSRRAAILQDRKDGLLPDPTVVPLSNNDERGPGVPTDGGESEGQKQVQSNRTLADRIARLLEEHIDAN